MRFTSDRRAFLAAAAAGVLLPRAVQAQSAAMRIGAIPFDNAAEVFYAQRLGTFAKNGLNVEITPLTSGGAITAAVAGGSLDIGFSNLALPRRSGSRPALGSTHIATKRPALPR